MLNLLVLNFLLSPRACFICVSLAGKAEGAEGLASKFDLGGWPNSVGMLQPVSPEKKLV
jgi:hypothetical protein